ncbi:MAG: rplU [Candidatus Nomurabacteria bacterium]|nr:rplU [Candidatus Nomurabacteria bacterium]
MTFAVIQTGGKQYKVTTGDTISTEILKGDHKVGDKITIDSVILTDDGNATKLGAPFIEGGKVIGTITKLGKRDKVMVVKYKAKSRYHKRNGHRQPFMDLKIDSIA